MSKTNLRLLILLFTVSVVGLTLIQIYWIRKAYQLQERQFTESVTNALRRSVAHMSSPGASGSVVALSPSHYLVALPMQTEKNSLPGALQSELAKEHLSPAFSCEIYHPGQALSDGRFTAKNGLQRASLPSAGAQLLVRFADEPFFIARQLDGSILVSVFVLLCLLLFAYILNNLLREKQMGELQREFIHNMTHELQTPISAIRMASDVLSMPRTLDQPERVQKYVRMVQDESRRLQHQVETVLTLARTEKKVFALRLEPIEVHELLRVIASRHDDRVDLRLNATDTAIFADRLHLTNVVTNLLDNAFKYSPADPQIRLSTGNEADTLFITVRDNGIGIPREYQTRIFEAYYRVPGIEEHNVKGFGLGLSYVQKIVKAHRWKLDLDSTPGEGSAFTIRIPLSTRSQLSASRYSMES